MAILMILDWHGIPPAEYDRLNDAMGIHSDADAPEGLIAHTAAVTDDGDLIVADVWESEEALRAFADSRLIPSLHELGLPEAQPQIRPVHNRLRGRSADANVLVVVELPGARREDYDRLAAELPDEHTDGNHPAHEHVGAAGEDGLVVVDLWPSVDAFEQFIGGRVGPAAERIGADMSAMKIRTARVHNRIHGRATASI
jgi:heme-degrading monooxygenase HmoA